MKGSQLRKIRKHLGLSMDEFAIELGYAGNADGNRNTIKRFETEKRPIPPPVARLAHMLWVHGVPEWPHDVDSQFADQQHALAGLKSAVGGNS